MVNSRFLNNYNDDEEEVVLVIIGHHPISKIIVKFIRAVLAKLVHKETEETQCVNN